MIYLFTGVPGASKTLNAIKFIDNEPSFNNRPVYYFNIENLTLDWNLLTEDEMRQWYNLPHGSVIVIDECQKIYRPRKFGDTVPAYVTELETHRHKGFDIILITQHPMLADVAIRRFVGRHFHFHRPFGMQSATRYTWEECQSDPREYHAKQSAIKDRINFDKKYFGVYKSAEVHTVKRKIPYKMIAIVAFAVIAIGASIFSVLGMVSRNRTQPPEEMDVLNVGRSVNAAQHFSWEESHITRIPNIPWSAPVYDGVHTAVTYPKPQCISSAIKCRCYSQQGTMLDIQDAICMQIVKYGVFDYAKPDGFRGEREEVRQRERQTSSL